MSREYEVTYITKEYLMKNGWTILAYNPPGSQGTFTIPNPEKDPNYRGQTGSESPDIIAFKIEGDKNLLLIVEAKPHYDQSDVEKMKNLFRSSQRLDLFLHILHNQAKANDIQLDLNKESMIIFGKAHFGEINPREDMRTFKISIKNEKWNPENFKANEDVYGYFGVEEIIPFEK